MGKVFWCDNKGPFVDTTLGTVRGYFTDELYIFHGIRYGQAKRFEMPEPATPWEGIKDAITYGPVAPTINKPTVGPSAAHRLDPCFRYNFWPESEDCQYVNVWTRTLDSTAKKPVMVWIHGGGFSSGSSVEQHSYDPSNLARENDIVVVSLNHRLNILGYLDLSAFGEKYKNSGNVGMADIVLALQWVKDNVSKFGGDPDNITLFGQSGGGGKIQTLMQMPVADNLYNKVIIQSGVLYPFFSTTRPIEDGQTTAAAVVRELGLTAETIDEIQNVPFDDLCKAYYKIVPEIRAKGMDSGFGPTKNDYFLGDGVVYGYTEKALNTPMICGSCQCETYHFADDFSNYDMSDEEKYARVKEAYGEHTDEMIELFKKTYPDDDILNLYHLDTIFRRGSFDVLDKKSDGPAPVWSYMLDYTFKLFGGMPAYHGCDLPMVFNNTDVVLCTREPGARKIGDQMSRAWANFAKYGDPNHDSMPEWKTWTREHSYSMVFAETDRCVENLDRELIMRSREYRPLTMQTLFSKETKKAIT